MSVAGFAHGTYSALTDSNVALYSESGALITFDDDAGRHISGFNFADGFLTFTAHESGTYFVEAGAFQNLTGGYTILVDTRASDAVSYTHLTLPTIRLV